MSKIGVFPPWHRGNPIEEMAFNLYAMSIEEKRERMRAAFYHLTECPADYDIIPQLYELTDEEWELVQEGVF